MCDSGKQRTPTGLNPAAGVYSCPFVTLLGEFYRHRTSWGVEVRILLTASWVESCFTPHVVTNMELICDVSSSCIIFSTETWRRRGASFFFFRHWTFFNGWKLRPSQRHLSISLDPGRRLSNFVTFIWQMSCLTLSSHRYLGLRCDFWLEDSI